MGGETLSTGDVGFRRFFGCAPARADCKAFKASLKHIALCFLAPQFRWGALKKLSRGLALGASLKR